MTSNHSPKARRTRRHLAAPVTVAPGAAVLVALVLVAIGATSCGSSSKASPSTSSTASSTGSPTTTEEAKPKMLAATPPMGWNSWNQVRCKGLNEDVVKHAADALVHLGLAELGYRYVVVDDCWQAPERDAKGELQADPTRFPSGLKGLADYVHAKGLKFGLYLAPGSETCAMYWDHYAAKGIGSYGHERQDAQMLQRVGVDYLKYDWCRADETNGLERQAAFTKMHDELGRLDRPIVYSVSEYGKTKPWTWAPRIANLWRTTSDIEPNWPSIARIIDSQADLYSYSGPGHWNDPDMLQVGNGNLTADEAQAHVGMWAMLAAPLMIGTDLDKVTPEVRAALSNPEVIAIDQDLLGKQAQRVVDGDGEVWARKLDGGDFAVALLNKSAAPLKIETTLSAVGAPAGTWKVREVTARTDRPSTDGSISTSVPSHGLTILRLSKS